MEPNAERIELGSVSSVNPARRELRVAVEPGYEYAFDDLEWVRVQPRAGAELRCRVTSVKDVPGGICVALTPGVLRETVAGLKGARIVAAPGELKEPPAEERSLLQAVGFEVVGIDGRTIGTLADVFATPAHGILEIEKADGATLLVPAIEEVIADIEWDRARVVVNDLTPYGVEDAH